MATCRTPPYISFFYDLLCFFIVGTSHCQHWNQRVSLSNFTQLRVEAFLLSGLVPGLVSQRCEEGAERAVSRPDRAADREGREARELRDTGLGLSLSSLGDDTSKYRKNEYQKHV